MRGEDLFSCLDFSHTELFPTDTHPWHPLKMLKEYMNDYCYAPLTRLRKNGGPLETTMIFHKGEIRSAGGLAIEYGDATKGELQVFEAGKPLVGASVIMAGAVLLGGKIAIGEGVLIESGALIKSPTILGDNCEIRQGAYLRGYCLAGKRCVLGHTTEVKHSIFFNDAKAGHFAYLGDSILGTNANLGAGTKFANLRFLPGNVMLQQGEERIDTGLRKLGAILGDECQTGCNSVTSPGTIMGKKAMLLPNVTAKSGFHKAGAIIR